MEFRGVLFRYMLLDELTGIQTGAIADKFGWVTVVDNGVIAANK